MDDFGKLSYNLLVHFFSKSQYEQDNYDFSEDCAKLIDIFSKIPGEPLDEISHGQISLQYLDNINQEEDQPRLIDPQNIYDVINAADIESPNSLSDSSDKSDIKLIVPPVPVDSHFRKAFPHVAECYDQLSSGEIHLDREYQDINDMWNEASVACLVSPAELERTKSTFTQSLIEYLINSNKNNTANNSNCTNNKDVKKLLNLMSWYFAGYYTAKLEG